MSLVERYAGALRRAREAHPDLSVRDEAFASELDRECAGNPELLAQLHVEDLYLARAVAAQDPKAIARFEAEYLSRVRPAIAHLGDASFADEVTQRLRVGLLTLGPSGMPKIVTYGGRGELLRWVRAAAARVALTLRAEQRPGRREDANVDLAELPFGGDDPQVELMRRQYGEKFREAMRVAVASLPPATRVELRQYYFEGLGVEELGALYRVAASTISRRLAKARELLLQRTRDVLCEQLGLSQSQVDSVLRLIRGQLDISRGAFDSGGPSWQQ